MWHKKVVNNRIFNNLTAKNKYILYAGAVLLIIILVMSVGSISLYSSLAHQKVVAAVSEQLHYASKAVDMEINAYARVLLTMYIDKSLHELILEGTHGAQSTPMLYYYNRVERLEAYIKRLLSGVGVLPELTLYLEPAYQPYTPMVQSLASTREIQHQSWYQEAVQSKRYAIRWAVEHDEQNGAMLTGTLLLRDYYYNTRARIACAHLRQSMRWLDRPLRNALDLQTGALYITDAQGTLLYASNNAQAGAQLLAQLAGTGWAHTATGEQQAPAQGGRVYYYYNPKMDWQLIYLTDDNIYSDTTYAVGQFILVLVLPIILLSVGLLVISSQLMTGRLVRLKNAVEKIDADHLHLHAALPGGDEVGVLADSFNRVLAMVRNLLVENRAIERQRYRAELLALQERANPHFLYNTLSLVSAMAVDIDAYDISDALACLADFYRLSLSHGDIITVREELHMLRLYADLCNRRFGDRIAIHIDVPESLLGCYTPKLILQPFLENAVLHGLRTDSLKQDHIRVTGALYNGRLVFTIADNGVGMEPELLKRITAQQDSDTYHAIENTHKRIVMHFGPPYGVVIHSRAGEGTIVTVTIPYRTQPDASTPRT